MDKQILNVGGIEVHYFTSNDNKSNPLIFITHGRNGTIDSMFGFSKELSQMGFNIIAVEQRNHGKRLIDKNANMSNINMAVDMYSIFIGTAMDISLLIDALFIKYNFTPTKIGVSGISLGGHATIMAMNLDKRIDVGVAFIGSGDYNTLMDYRKEKLELSQSEKNIFYSDKMKQWIKRTDPINNPAIFGNRPLLMLNGEADDLVQLDCNNKFFEKIKGYYDNPEMLKLKTYPNIKHQVISDMYIESKNWFKKWMK